ncbi:DUF4041 domain-containing protein [Actinomadura macrotermitis]|uniref:Bacteriophage T5 Orf172 DNA-binding domain-containing protein n=1 Tax=Actinomadura macrotermitis TaxID=2585200 RepID=A0A7K0C8P8_9ACTN|nr:DUF4041 domain-containing protein [Actinomadura macrotermitis]MQY09472.1 hypothetical protein [Actinomadura macrotermitis]
MTVRPFPADVHIGSEVDPAEAERLFRLLGLFLGAGERPRALVTTVKALPKLTHLAITDRRVLGFVAADLAQRGPCQETPLSSVVSVETRPSYQQRLFLVIKDTAGEESDFGDVTSQDAPHMCRLIQSLPTPAPAPAPQPAPAPALAPAPAGWRYNPPPTWPAPPVGWTPPPGWQPDPSWPLPPAGWQFWLPAEAPAPPVPAPMPVPQPPLPHATLPPPSAPAPRPVFGGKKQRIEELEAENARLYTEVVRLGGLEPQQLRAEIEDLRSTAATLRKEARDKRGELSRLRAEIVETKDLNLLQEAGVYEYRHRLADAVAYQAELAKIKDRIKTMTRSGKAVTAATDWTVNGSAAEGRAMVRDFSKLLLRAYNAEADNLVRMMRPYKLDSSVERLGKTAQTIERLGKTMHIKVSRAYHELRVKELRLTADHLAKAEEEKERIRAERERQREEEKARKEFEREKARLLKERSHVESALARLEARGDQAGADELRAKLADVDGAIHDVEGRAANTRAGYVYVISNIGAFGERMVKIGLTRRLDPMDRVRELGDASVPFRFDVHALIFSEDAVGLEGRLHQEFMDKRVNHVNVRREFFYATPAEVRDALGRIAGNHLLEYTETPEALEWRASRNAAAAG